MRFWNPSRWLTHPRREPLEVFGLSYAVLLSVWIATCSAVSFALWVWPGNPTPRVLAPQAFVPIALAFWTPIFLTGLFVNVPLLVGIRLARRRLPPLRAGLIVASSLTMWQQWVWYRMEWFDVWRHGVPDVRYFLSGPVQAALAFAAAGAVIGIFLVGESRQRAPAA
jgi:hypothetical protein